MSRLQRNLQISLHNYWHAGGGRSSGHHLDALCERDGTLPILPGRQLKGLLRHAVRRAEAWGWLDDIPLPAGPMADHQSLLFGSASQAESRDATQPGVLMVGSAVLPEAERHWLATPANAELASLLFDELFNTAINDQGSAKAHSLRGIEVALPGELTAALELHSTAQDNTLQQQQRQYLESDAPWQAIQTALPLLDHVGAHRSRGLGECLAQLSGAGA